MGGVLPPWQGLGCRPEEVSFAPIITSAPLFGFQNAEEISQHLAPSHRVHPAAIAGASPAGWARSGRDGLCPQPGDLGVVPSARCVVLAGHCRQQGITEQKRGQLAAPPCPEVPSAGELSQAAWGPGSLQGGCCAAGGGLARDGLWWPGRAAQAGATRLWLCWGHEPGPQSPCRGRVRSWGCLQTSGRNVTAAFCSPPVGQRTDLPQPCGVSRQGPAPSPVCRLRRRAWGCVG